MNVSGAPTVYREFVNELRSRGIPVEETNGIDFPGNAAMHDRAAAVPAVIVSPHSEWGVIQTLRLMTELRLHGQVPLSVKSGGHGYFNGATCTGIMINLANLTQRRIVGDTLFLEPGCILAQTIDVLARNRRAVPHGDCFGVGAGGHFLTAGWDLILARKYGLGCQSVVGGRVVRWDGSVLEVDEDSHPDLLLAMRGGAAAEVGVVTEIRLRLIPEPPRATWRFTRITREQLETCVAQRFFARSAELPREISVSVRIHFEPDQPAPVCSFNIVSLLTAEATVRVLRETVGDEITDMVAELSEWSEKTLLDLRMLPASEFLTAHPQMLGEVTAEALHADPLRYWKRTSSMREMASSYFTSISHWVVPDCEPMLLDLYAAFETAQAHPLRERMYTLVILGGGRMTELRDRCAMPLGEALARFELHWDNPETDEAWSRDFTDAVHSILRSNQDPGPQRPYRGDIWLPEQAYDPRLEAIRTAYAARTPLPEQTALEALSL
ncbi:FAD-binding oxidoreductase [Nocardia mexicana]|uniref:FAD binding domain-containing protein n=1 Tax=Nocardia mexicana TaxID=279262 RepID=A0A370HIN6_9NOCA|nr:FAD-binding oxidoreductase [Nocardia mexicana]RDI55339.1 FAD binding domain-containing protein [Nocardia mexicana]